VDDTPDEPAAMVLALCLPYSQAFAAPIIRGGANCGAMASIRTELGT
jgi:hypothetical protein